ncbi:uncharacterized protein LOC110682046 isoform X1 [Chenopodium quinoa]|uniref:uncharacterized protein LOC110682046 isoform X1 n=1 Tax=Chenopodium quinoa TaxID=63459 RepID=UPI000B76FE80|nr:uncharacterized protein LOC110682046 isoform X1 [Chenopodium quinoa]
MNSLTSKSKPIYQFLLSRSSPSSSPSKILCISLFSTSSSSASPNSCKNYSSAPSPSRRHDEVSKNVKVSVWWDIENCSVPNGINVFKITHGITSAIRENGIKGPVQVTAFGDVVCLSRANQEALTSTGVNLVHIPRGGKNSADRSLIVDLMYWVCQNPPPAHIFLISGDRDFAGILHKLRMNNYNILLAANTEGRHNLSVLCSAASIMWNWNELARGEHLIGWHYNQPPDGPFNSWYGHHRGPFEDPYEVSDNSSKVEVSSESNYHPVPVVVLRQLRRIINAYPKGLTIGEFRNELVKMKVPIGKNYYGHNKLSVFLMSVPHILKIESGHNGMYFIRPVAPKVRKSVEGNGTSVGSTSEKKQEVGVTRKEYGQANTITRMEDINPQLPVSPYIDRGERTLEDMGGNVTPENKVLDVAQKDDQVASTNAEVVEIPVAPKEEQHLLSKFGMLKQLWFGTGTDAEETRLTKDVKDAKSKIHDKSDASPGFIRRVISWCNPWRNSSVKKSTEISSQEPGCIEEDSQMLDGALHSKRHDLFCKDTFWSAIQSFLRSRRGSDIVLNSSSRGQLAERLQKEGPFSVRPLQESDLHHLIDLLVSEKEWIKEFPTQTPRFKIFLPTVESTKEVPPQNVQPQRSNGLSSIFKSSSSVEKPETKVSSDVHKKPSESSRGDVLADCQKLLDELLSQNPDGFNMGVFKKSFLYKYGYSLDHQKLGYPKLVSLLQIMPGVKIMGGYIYSDSVVYSIGIESLGLTDQSPGPDSDVSDSPRKNVDGESPWEELGPVAKQESEFSPSQVNGKYEPFVSDDDEFSEWEEDITTSQVKAEDQNRSRMDEEDSSLLQILDSWYSTKDESEPQDHGSHAEGLVDCSEESEPPQTSNSTNTSVQGKAAALSASAFNHARKQSSRKSYMFVADPIETKKDKLIDGILGSLKKSGDSKLSKKRSGPTVH